MKKQLEFMILVIFALLLSMLVGCGGEDRIPDRNCSDERYESDGTSALPVTSVQTEGPSNDQESANNQESMWGELPPVPLA